MAFHVALALLLCGAAVASPREELERLGVRLDEAHATLSDDEVQALVDGLRALPEKLRVAPLRVQVSPDASDFGMGDATEAKPLWRDGAFILYAYREPVDERAHYRAEKLTQQERRTLWRRRAMVHARLQRFDDAWKVSRSQAFRLATGWLLPGDRPLARSELALNQYAWAYSRALGQKNASLDFVTFAEEALVTPSDISPERAEPLDDAVACQEFTKRRILRSALIRAGASSATLPPVPCPQFDQFSDVSGIDHVEIILSAPSSTSPESLFGHLLIRPVYKWSAETPAPSFEPVMEIGAFAGIDTPTIEYVWNGLTGGSTTFFAFNSMALVLKRSLESEQRSLTRFRLNLSPEETARLMQRMWELERRGYFPYYFFTENCAAWMQFLLDAVVDEERRLGRTGSFWVAPLQTLDSLAGLKAANGRPLLEPMAETYQPSGATALAEERKLEGIIEELKAQRPGIPWDQVFAARTSNNPVERRAMYDALADALPGAPPELSRALTRSLLRMERFAADDAAAREQKLKDKARIKTSVAALPTAEDLLVSRQRRYQRERAVERYVDESSLLVKLRTMMDALPLRELTPDEQADLERFAETQETFQRVAILHAQTTTAEQNRAMELAESLAARARAKDLQARSLFRSSSNRLQLGAAALRSGDGRLRPSLFLRGAVVAEDLGEPRVAGFGAEYGVKLGDVRALLGVEGDRPSVFWADVDVVQLRTLGRRPEYARTSLIHHVGWGIGFGYSHRRLLRDEQLHRLLISGDLFRTTLRSFDFARHLSLGIGALIDVPLAPAGLNTGLRSILLARLPLPGHGVNALRAELTLSQRYALLGRSRLVPIQEATAALEAPLFLSEHGGPGFVLRPRAELFAQRTGGGQFALTGFLLAAGEWD